MNQIREKFPSVLQISMNMMYTNQSAPNMPPTFKAHGTDSVSNIKYVANNYEQAEKVLGIQLREVIAKTEILKGNAYA
jgi:hypothetical protein